MIGFAGTQPRLIQLITSWRLTSKQRKILAIGLLIVFTCSVSISAIATGNNLTDIFNTKAFRGSWEVINKFNFIGSALNTVISVFSLLGLFLVMYSRLMSLLYLSCRPLFNQVYDLKKYDGSEDTKFFGFGVVAKKAFQGGYGIGTDSIVSFFLSILPNVKKYSDYNPDIIDQLNLKEEDNAWTYILRTAPTTIAIIFFFAIGFSGTLAKMYGTVVNGMVAVADNVVAINLEGYVDRLFSAGKNYTFTVGADGSSEGTFKEDLAKKVYKKAIINADVNDEKGRDAVGKTAEDLIKSRLGESQVASLLGVDSVTDSDWKNISSEVRFTTNSDGGDRGIVIPMSDLIPKYNKQEYIHVYLRLNKGDSDYFNTEG